MSLLPICLADITHCHLLILCGNDVATTSTSLLMLIEFCHTLHGWLFCSLSAVFTAITGILLVLVKEDGCYHASLLGSTASHQPLLYVATALLVLVFYCTLSCHGYYYANYWLVLLGCAALHAIAVWLLLLWLLLAVAISMSHGCYHCCSFSY